VLENSMDKKVQKKTSKAKKPAKKKPAKKKPAVKKRQTRKPVGLPNTAKNNPAIAGFKDGIFEYASEIPSLRILKFPANDLDPNYAIQPACSFASARGIVTINTKIYWHGSCAGVNHPLTGEVLNGCNDVIVTVDAGERGLTRAKFMKAIKEQTSPEMFIEGRSYFLESIRAVTDGLPGYDPSSDKLEDADCFHGWRGQGGPCNMGYVFEWGS
jgi:hypothetical protein